MSQFQSRTLEMQTIHGLLSSGIRRAVLRRLRHTDQTTAKALGRHATAIADDSNPNRQTATVALVHDHLPRLDAHNIVEYDRSETTVSPGPSFDEIEPFVDRLERDGG